MRYSGDIWKEHPCCVLVAKETFISGHGEVVQKSHECHCKSPEMVHTKPHGQRRATCSAGTAKAICRSPRKFWPKCLKIPGKADLVHPEWHIPRIGFQPYPYPSATAFIIDQLRDTRVEGNTDFLKHLQTGKAVVRSWWIDTFIVKALDRFGGIETFCDCSGEYPYVREESVEIN